MIKVNPRITIKSNYRLFPKIENKEMYEYTTRKNLMNEFLISPLGKSIIFSNNSRSISWPYAGISTNALMHTLTVSRRIGYKVAAWNCRRGLISSDRSNSAKSPTSSYICKNTNLIYLESLKVIFMEQNPDLSESIFCLPITCSIWKAIFCTYHSPGSCMDKPVYFYISGLV